MDNFLGRADEQGRFIQVLEQVQETFAPESLLGKLRPSKPQSQRLPYIFLLHGIGGMGKTRLGRKFIAIADPNFLTLRLDWEECSEYAVETKFSLADPKLITFEALYYHIYTAFRNHGFGDQFNEYENTQSKRQEVESKVSKLIRGTGVDPQNRYAPLAKLGATLLGTLVRMMPVVGGQLDKEQTDAALTTMIAGGATGLALTRELAADWMNENLSPDERDLYQQPHEQLSRDLAKGIRAVTRQKPLLFVLDTYEIVDQADIFLRLIIKQAGANVIWVIAGRQNLADSQRIGRKSVIGYIAEFGTQVVRSIPMSEFSLQEVGTYLLRASRERRRELTPEVAQAVHQATAGIPLAVKEAAAIWAANKPLSVVPQYIAKKYNCKTFNTSIEL